MLVVSLLHCGNMSYDLTIKPDETYSRFTPRGPLEEFITKLPGVKRNGETGFVLDDRPRRWMEIDLEVVSAEGDLLEAEVRIPMNSDTQSEIVGQRSDNCRTVVRA